MITSQRYEKEQLDRSVARKAALAMWKEMTDNERSLIQYGLFPDRLMDDRDAVGVDDRLLKVALMELAAAHGGMVTG